jgi:hypothetical protein
MSAAAKHNRRPTSSPGPNTQARNARKSRGCHPLPISTASSCPQIENTSYYNTLENTTSMVVRPIFYHRSVETVEHIGTEDSWHEHYGGAPTDPLCEAPEVIKKLVHRF